MMRGNKLMFDFFFKKNYSKNAKNNILLFSEFSVFFNFVFKNYSQRTMPNIFIYSHKTIFSF